MTYPILHFGFFDREALAHGRVVHRDPASASALGRVFLELFGPLPGRGVPQPGFFCSYGVLSCVCPRPPADVRMPVELILDLVRRTGCDVAYVSPQERWIIELDRLVELLQPASNLDDDPW